MAKVLRITKLDRVGLPEIYEQFPLVARLHEIKPALFDKYLRLIPTISFSVRVMARLAQLEAREPLVSFRDDYRLAWLTVFYANDVTREWSSDFGPWEFSFCSMFGKHPNKVIKEFLDRERKHLEMELPPKKPVQSVPSPDPKRKKAA